MHLPIHLDRNSREPLQNQLFEQLRGLIVSGQLRPDTRIIATRFLGQQLSISRTTVLLAYERLIAEGYLETRPAIGTFVSRSLPIGTPFPTIGEWTERTAQSPRIDFSLQPDTKLFPWKPWLRTTQAILENQARHPAPHDTHASGQGSAALRAIISEWLGYSRGIVATPEQILLVSGRQQGLAIAASLAAISERRTLVEEPGDLRANNLFRRMGAKLRACGVDRHGLIIDHLPGDGAAALYVTPSRQRPTGGSLPLDRREAVLRWAHRHEAWIIEDDSDSDFRYAGTVPPALFSLDDRDYVLYLRGFSDMLSAGLSLAYLVLPERMVAAALRIKDDLTDGPSWLDQRVLGEFIGSGDYDRHLRTVRKICLEHRDCLTDCLERHFGPTRPWGMRSGTHIAWPLPEGVCDGAELVAAAGENGLRLYRPLASFRTKNAGLARQDLLLLGYGSLDPAQIAKGIDLLAETIRSIPPARRRSGAGA